MSSHHIAVSSTSVTAAEVMHRRDHQLKKAQLLSDEALAYLRRHHVPENVNRILDIVLSTMPEDPILLLEQEFRKLVRTTTSSQAQSSDHPESVKCPLPVNAAPTLRSADDFIHDDDEDEDDAEAIKVVKALVVPETL